jgi:hypothetical protein
MTAGWATCGVDEAILDPRVPGAAWVAGGADAYGDVGEGGAVRCCGGCLVAVRLAEDAEHAAVLGFGEAGEFVEAEVAVAGSCVAGEVVAVGEVAEAEAGATGARGAPGAGVDRSVDGDWNE